MNSANETISDETERMYYYHFLSVIKYSSKLWMTSEQGGENGLSLIKFSLESDSSGDSLLRRAPGWKIFTSDALGVVQGAANSLLMSGGASALPNPALGGLPTASAVGLVTGAIASVKTAIF